MGRIEAYTYAYPCYKAGFSQVEAEKYTLLYGLYPFWLENSALTASSDRAAHDAWLEGIRRHVEEIYQTPFTGTIPERSPIPPNNPLALERRKVVEAGETPTAKARLEAVTKLSHEGPVAVPMRALEATVGSQPEKLAMPTSPSPLAQPADLETAFHEAMLSTYIRAGREVGYWPHRFRQAVLRHGGLGWAKLELQKTRKGIVLEGFQRLLDAGRLDLSIEALVVDPAYAPLFSAEERRIAQARLNAYGPSTLRLPVKPEENFPEVVVQDAAYQEGSVRSITVNAYERSSKARAACLEHYGHSCAACDMDFEATYGEIGKDFIHVHHVVPLALMREAYTVDPVKDLIPVCPNCHAMLHTSSPPLSVHELKQVLDSQARAA